MEGSDEGICGDEGSEDEEPAKCGATELEEDAECGVTEVETDMVDEDNVWEVSAAVILESPEGRRDGDDGARWAAVFSPPCLHV